MAYRIDHPCASCSVDNLVRVPETGHAGSWLDGDVRTVSSTPVRSNVVALPAVSRPHIHLNPSRHRPWHRHNRIARPRIGFVIGTRLMLE